MAPMESGYPISGLILGVEDFVFQESNHSGNLDCCLD